MRAILTGMNGTVAPVVGDALKKEGYEVVQYDRSKISTENEKEVRAFIEHINPELLMHFATGSIAWTKMLAKIAKELNIQYVYISSVSVYNPNQHPHPYAKTLEPEPKDDYGTYKLEGEAISKKANPNTYIARISWQIGHEKGSNNMIDHLYKQMEEKGYIEASSNFYPSSAFLEDTAIGLIEMLGKSPGIYHLNSNHSLSFYDIVTALKERHPSFIVKQTQEPAIDVRMVDDSLNMPLLETTLKRFTNR